MNEEVKLNKEVKEEVKLKTLKLSKEEEDAFKSEVLKSDRDISTVKYIYKYNKYSNRLKSTTIKLNKNAYEEVKIILNNSDIKKEVSSNNPILFNTYDRGIKLNKNIFNIVKEVKYN